MGRGKPSVNLSPMSPGEIRVPSGLSLWASGVWRELVQSHEFESHELITFQRALQWWDRSDAAAERADRSIDPADVTRLVKLAIDCASAALRHWRVLKFPPPGGARLPGRPSGDDWSEKRRLQKAAS